MQYEDLLFANATLAIECKVCKLQKLHSEHPTIGQEVISVKGKPEGRFNEALYCIISRPFTSKVQAENYVKENLIFF